MDFIEKARRCREFIDALDDERRKIEVFQRELPLCLHLINQTIESYKRLIVNGDAYAEPVMKEFISLKPTENVTNDNQREDGKLEQKNSLHLCTQESDQQPKMDVVEKPIAVRFKRSWRPIDNEHVDDHIESCEASVEVVNSDQVDGNDEGEEKEEKSSPKRKVRRCWSEELHNRFVQALEQLGGCHVATPKQIREVMKEDGLTNDEVKSHLQKYRLHTRRTNSSVENNSTNNNNNNIPAQYIVVSGIWIPQLAVDATYSFTHASST